MLGAVVLNFNTTEMTIATVRRLVQIDLIRTVVVVDNQSSTGSLELETSCAAMGPRVIFISSPTNDGYASGNNLGIRLLLDSGFDRVLVLNPDVEIDSDSVNMLHRALSREGVHLVCPVLIDETGAIDAVGGYYYPLIGRGRPGTELVMRENSWWRVSTPAGACFMARASSLLECGLLPDLLFLYGEEIDIEREFARRQMRWKVCEGAIALHRRGGSTLRQGTRSLVSYRAAAESAVLVTSRWWPRLLPLVIAARIGAVVQIAAGAGPAAARASLAGITSGLRLARQSRRGLRKEAG